MGIHKNLEIWHLGISLVLDIYQITSSFPKQEMYGLTAQLRRCAVSVPSNIAEGAARKTRKEYIHSLYITLGSLSELETQILISYNLGYTKNLELMEKIEALRKENNKTGQISKSNCITRTDILALTLKRSNASTL